jgi:hypothetical protein
MLDPDLLVKYYTSPYIRFWVLRQGPPIFFQTTPAPPRYSFRRGSIIGVQSLLHVDGGI